MIKRGLKKLIAIITIISIIVIPGVALASDDEAVLYGRNELSKLEKGESYLFLYDTLEKAVTKHSESVNIRIANVTYDEFMLVYQTFVNDNPSYFWVRNGAMGYINSLTKKVGSCKPQYADFRDLASAKEVYEDRVREILSGVDDSWSDVEKAKYLHDYICNNVEYDTTAQNQYNAYGALVEGRAVCEGYSRAMQDLLQRVGIECFAVMGECVKGTVPVAQNDAIQSKTVESHMWNLVKLDGKYYHLDVTWDDQNGFVYYGYFNVSTEKILKDHIIEKAQVNIANADSTLGIYYISGKTEEEIDQIGKASERNEKLIAGVKDTTISISTSASSKAMTVKIFKSKGYAVDGYQIYRSTSGKKGTFKKIKTLEKSSYKNTGLTSGKRYYYKVRGYRNIGEEIVYTKWSNVSYRKAK